MKIFYLISELNRSPISINKNMYKESNRYLDFTKTDILKASWLSIQPGLNEEDTIHLICSGVSDDTQLWLQNTAAEGVTVITHEVPAMDDYDHPYPNYHHIRVNHFIPQFEYIYSIIEKNPEEYYYICSDDYLHVPNAMSNIKLLIKNNLITNLFFIPQDNPDLYADNSVKSRIFTSSFGYMREIPNSTPNMVAEGTTFLMYRPEIQQAAVFASDSWTNIIFQKTTAIGPIPGWSTHFQDNCIAPFIDWKSLADYYLKGEQND